MRRRHAAALGSFATVAVMYVVGLVESRRLSRELRHATLDYATKSLIATGAALSAAQPPRHRLRWPMLSLVLALFVSCAVSTAAALMLVSGPARPIVSAVVGFAMMAALTRAILTRTAHR